MSAIIATAPAETKGVEYVISIANDGPSRIDRRRFEIRVNGGPYRSLLIDVTALDGLVEGLRRAADLRDAARVQSAALIERLKGDKP